LVAAAVVSAGHLLGWRGVDFAAQVYRVDMWRRAGFQLWDFGWYGGHWTLDYSVLYPALAGAAGIGALTSGSAALAALSFDRIARRPLGAGGWPASLLFAAGTLVAASIGQLTFLTGEAFGLAALWAASSARSAPLPSRPAWHRSGAAPALWAVAGVLAVCAALTSPLAGGFVALAAGAWSLPGLLAARRGALAPAILAVVAVAPVVTTAALFPGEGAMPYPLVDYLWEVLVATAVAALALAGALAAPRAAREGCWSVVSGAALFVAAASVAVAVPSPLGGNVGRIEDSVALPLAVGLACSLQPFSALRPVTLVARALLVAALGVPLALSEWTPAWGAIASAPSQPSTTAAFYAPLDGELRALGGAGPAGRVEVVPTAYHWESLYVAQVAPLARGWERQLDVSDNPIFYRPGALSPLTYRAWLLDNGVRFVALPRAPLDMAGGAEGRLVASGKVPGLAPVWSDRYWRLYRVEGSPGVVAAPARLLSASDDELSVLAPRPGTLVVRVRYAARWRIAAGAGSLVRSPQGWISLRVPRPEVVTLRIAAF
jgi:hypothetical protein